MRTVLEGDAELARRTFAMLAGDLECPDLEDTMPRDLVNDASVNLRLPSAMLERVEVLRAVLLERNATLMAVGSVTQAVVLRLALAHGIAALEAEYGDAPGEG